MVSPTFHRWLADAVLRHATRVLRIAWSELGDTRNSRCALRSILRSSQCDGSSTGRFQYPRTSYVRPGRAGPGIGIGIEWCEFAPLYVRELFVAAYRPARVIGNVAPIRARLP